MWNYNYGIMVGEGIDDMPRFKSEQICIRVSNKFKQQVEKLAQDQEMTVAEFIRNLIMKYMNEIENSKN